LKIDLGCTLVLKDVRHVSDILLNLIFTGKLDDEGYINHFSGGKWKLTKGSLIVAKGKKKSSFYTLHASICKMEVNAIEKKISTELWHNQLGHMSEKGMQILAKKSLLSGVEGTILETCDDCLAGKQHQISFKRSSHSTKSNRYLYSDLCGPLKSKL